jgi:hypothetical protein
MNKGESLVRPRLYCNYSKRLNLELCVETNMDVIFSSANKSLGAPLGVSVESVLLSTDSHITGIVMFWSIVFKETVASVLSSMR